MNSNPKHCGKKTSERIKKHVELHRRRLPPKSIKKRSAAQKMRLLSEMLRESSLIQLPSLLQLKQFQSLLI
jgi:hypothetical protein